MRDVLELGFRFPIEPLPYIQTGYAIEVRWCSDYVDVTSAAWAGFTGRCVCGTSLKRATTHVLERASYRTKCEVCGEDPQRFGTGQNLHRFGLTVHCGKNLPESGVRVGLHTELRALWARCFSSPPTELGETA